MTASPPLPIARDLRSDGLTRPTPEMWAAMRAHEPGWATFGDDPAVRALEERGAALAGKEAAVLVATGGMANLVALLAHTTPGDGLVADAAAHVLRSEHAGYAALAGLALRALAGRAGHLEAAQVAAALDARPAGRRQPAGLLWLETTHGAAGGTVQPADELAAVCDVARARGVAVHLDGARVLNAAAALGTTVAELLAPVDTAMVNLNKGLSAPMGALLCGSAAFVATARERLGRVGGASVHQAGYWAAAALVALDTMADRIADDHAVARRLADRLGEIPGVVVPAPATNIVLVETPPPLQGAALVAALRDRGVGAYPHAPTAIRLVTHRHVTAADADAVADELRALLAEAS